MNVNENASGFSYVNWDGDNEILGEVNYCENPHAKEKLKAFMKKSSS